MNAIGLFLANGEAVSPHLCGICKQVWTSLDSAERCCRCVYCGGCLDRSKSGALHGECRERQYCEAESKRLSRAVLVSDYSGPFLLKGKFYSDIERLFAALAEDEIPEFGFCRDYLPPTFVIDDFMSIVADQMHEGWEPYPCEELERGIAAWNKANEGNGSWVECGDRKWSRAELVRMRSVTQGAK